MDWAQWIYHVGMSLIIIFSLARFSVAASGEMAKGIAIIRVDESSIRNEA
jgi:hypothetical protein